MLAGPAVAWPLATMAWLLACGNGDDCDALGRCNSCIAEGARVSTPTGLVAIERLTVGDEVWAIDPLDGKRHRTKITDIRSARRECLRVTDERGRQLTATPDHPVWSTEDHDYVPIGRLVAAGHGSLLSIESGAPKPRQLRELEVFVGVSTVFDITVEHSLHNFAVDGFLVHNKSPPVVTTGPVTGTGTESSSATSGTETQAEAESGTGTTSNPTGTDGSGTTAATSTTGSTGTTAVESGSGSDATTSCEPLTEDATSIGLECDPNGAACPDGYVCFGFTGIIQQYSCQIECEMDCECPPEFTCQEMADKSGTFTLCAR